MADLKPAPEPVDKKLEKDAAERLTDARTQKQQVEAKVREAYFFLAPQRVADLYSGGSTTTQQPTNEADLQTSLGMEVGQDFATEILNTFMPSTNPWADQKAGVDLTEDQWDEIEEAVQQQTTAIMAGIKASNFYPAAAQCFMPDLAVGTVAMWIEDLRATEPIVCQPVPLRELEINVGPYGDVDDRFIVRNTKFKHIPALLPGVSLPKEIQKNVEKKGNGKCRVVWGFWRDWKDDRDVVWQSVITIDGKLVFSKKLTGEGSCPLVVGRFDPDPMFAFGSGPAIKCLPEFRKLDEVEALKTESIDQRIHPAWGYPDDGITNFSGGIEAGMGYPMRAGSGRDIVKLAADGDMNVAMFEISQMEQRIRRLHFVDTPEQKGKTPPTREQWLDEMAMAQRRIGTPGLLFWREFPAGVFNRFKYLFTARGSIQPITVNQKQVALVPYNPTEAAQDHQEVQVAGQLLQAANSYFPKTAQVSIDETKTLQNMQKKMRDKIVVFRTADEMKQAVDMMGSVMGGAGGGDPNAPPEGAPPQ
jgi:hypothetical protein